AAARADDLQGHQAVGALPAGLVDHAHPPIADFLQEVVVTERAASEGLSLRFPGRVLGSLCRHRPDDRLEGYGQTGEAILVGEEDFQVGGQFRVTSKPLPAVGRLPSFQRLQVRCHHLIQETIAVRRGDMSGLVHAALTYSPLSICRNARMARRSKPPTAVSVLPMWALTAATEYPCRCFNSGAVRCSSGNRTRPSARRSTCSLRSACSAGEGWLATSQASSREDDSSSATCNDCSRPTSRASVLNLRTASARLFASTRRRNARCSASLSRFNRSAAWWASSNVCWTTSEGSNLARSCGGRCVRASSRRYSRYCSSERPSLGARSDIEDTYRKKRGCSPNRARRRRFFP